MTCVSTYIIETQICVAWLFFIMIKVSSHRIWFAYSKVVQHKVKAFFFFHTSSSVSCRVRKSNHYKGIMNLLIASAVNSKLLLNICELINHPWIKFTSNLIDNNVNYKSVCLRLMLTLTPGWRTVARKKLQPRRTHGPLYEISRMKSSNIISLIKKKNWQYLVKFYRGDCLGSPQTGYGPGVLLSISSKNIHIWVVN